MSEKVTIEDLLGTKTVKAERLSASPGRIPGAEQPMPILTVKILEGDFEDREFKYGVITGDALKSILDNAVKKDGKLIIDVPIPNPEKRIQWINLPIK